MNPSILHASAILKKNSSGEWEPYGSIKLSFDKNAKLLGFGPNLEEKMPQANIFWNPGIEMHNDSLIDFNFGAIGANDGTRIMGNDSFTVTKNHDGRELSFQIANFISPEGLLYTVYRNFNKLPTHRIAVARFNAPNFLEHAEFNAANFLERAGGNTFHETAESGDPILGFAGESGYAKILAGFLEDSGANKELELINIEQAKQEIKILKERIED